MQTLKELQCQKSLVWSLVVMFSFFQAMPVGWSATQPVPVEAQGQSVSNTVDALANSPAPANSMPVPQQIIGFVDSTAFQLNNHPLSPATTMVTAVPATVTDPIEKVVIGPLTTVIPPVVQTHVDELKKTLGERFSVNAQLQPDGTYLVTAKFLTTVCDTNGLCSAMSGRSGLTEMQYDLSSNGILNKDSLKMDYWFDEKGEWFHPKGDLLFDAMKLLREGMNDMETLAFLAGTIVVTKVAADGAVNIRAGSREFAFKVYRDEEGILQVERFVQLPSTVQTYVDELKKRFGTGYDVTAMLRSDGTYIVRVGQSNTCSAVKGLACTQVSGAPGAFHSLKFILNENGNMNGDSVRAYYNGVAVNGKLLFDAMASLEASFHPAGSEWMPAPQYYIARLVQLASQITVKEASASLLRFDHAGRSYKAVRDANGNIKLEIELPLAVQAYVKELQEKVGLGFAVTAKLQTDGSYLIHISDTKDYMNLPTSRLQDLSFTLRELEMCSDNGLCRSGGFFIAPESLKAHYYGQGEINAGLLYEGVLALQNYCPPGVRCAEVYKSDPQQAIMDMTCIAVTSVDPRGAIHFTKDGVNWNVRRNPDGTVKVENESVIPPAVQVYVDTLKNTLGTGYKVTATLQKDGTYLVKVGVASTCPKDVACVAPMPGTFSSLEFSISKSGVVNRDLAKVDYRGVKVSGKLLFDVMAALEASFHPKGSEWMPAPQYYIARLVQLASQITIKEASESLLRFDLNGKSYKAVRGSNGNIKLEIEFPRIVRLSKKNPFNKTVSDSVKVSPFKKAK